MKQPGQHLPEAQIKVAIEIPHTPLNELRDQMKTAPVYFNGSTEFDPHHRQYNYAAWPATDTQEGRILSEELVPEAELLNHRPSPYGGEGTYETDYETNHSLAMNEHMMAAPLASYFDGPLAPALRKLGYDCVVKPLDNYGSQLFAFKYPASKTFNDVLARIAPGMPELVQEPRKAYSKQQVNENFAAGKLTSYGSSMTFNAPIWALLPPAVHNTLRQTTVTGNQDAGNAQASMGLMIFGRKLEAAMLPAEDWQDDPIDVLGYQINTTVTGYSEELPDNGRALAEATVAHIRKLEAL